MQSLLKARTLPDSHSRHAYKAAKVENEVQNRLKTVQTIVPNDLLTIRQRTPIIPHVVVASGCPAVDSKALSWTGIKPIIR